MSRHDFAGRPNFGPGALAAQIVRTGADFAIRVRTRSGSPALPILRCGRDGSYLSRFGWIPVRVIDAQVTVATPAGAQTERGRLVTSSMDKHRHPDQALPRTVGD